MRPFIDALDLRQVAAKYRAVIFDRIVPGLLNRLADNGLDAVVSHDLKDVAAFQLRHPLMPLFPPFDPRAQPSAGKGNTLIVMIEREGKAVALVGGRLIWVERTLAEEMRSLAFFYENRAMVKPEEYCIVAKGIGDEIRSCHVALSGSAFVAESERGRGVYAAMCRLLYTLIFAQWKWSHWVSLQTWENVKRISVGSAGFRTFHPRIFRVSDGQNVRDREYWLSHEPRLSALENFFRVETADLDIPFNWPSPEDIEQAKRDASEE